MSTMLQDRTAVITGNPYGIGRVAAQLFEREGARVICLDDGRDGWGAAAKLPHFQVDVCDAAALDPVVAQCAQRLGHLDILFNLAGRAVAQRFEDTTPETWNTMISRNLSAAFVCTQRFLPLLKGSRQGAVINHGSIDGQLGNPAVAAYSAAKGGIVALTHVMAHDLARYGIRANCISTGGIRDGDTRAKDAGLVALTPSGRTGTPADVANVALFLASSLAAYVNGANIVVDGGRTTITQGCYTP
jgi:NAD(P)-dependent dehydrogenase (short-subunit alcohol dehydrogenase family)